MFDSLLERSRRIRHVLDAWCLLPVCCVCGAIPLIGLPIGLGIALLGIFAAFRLARYGMVFQCLLLFCLFCFLGGILVVGNLAFIPNPLDRFRSIEPQAPPPANQAVFVSRFAPHTPILPVTPPSLPVTPVRASAQASRSPTNPSAKANLSKPTVRLGNPQLFDEAKATTMAWLDGRNTCDLSHVIYLCDDQVEVNGTSIPRHDLIARIGSVDESYSADQENITEGPKIVPMTVDRWRVTFQVSFVRLRASNEFRIRGQRYRTIILRDDGAKFKIAGDSYVALPILEDPKVVVAGIEGSRIQTLLATCVQSDIAGDFDTGMACYASQVNYFDESRNKQEIKLDKELYAKRWPRRFENFDTLLRLEMLPDQRILARFYGQFRTESPERGEWSSGTIEHRFVLIQFGNRLQIVEQSGTVSDSQKGKLGSEEAK